MQSSTHLNDSLSESSERLILFNRQLIHVIQEEREERVCERDPSGYSMYNKTRCYYDDPQHGRLQVLIEGERASEKISLLKNNVIMPLENQRSVLTMSQTFDVVIMNNIIASLKKQLTAHQFIVPTITVLDDAIDETIYSENIGEIIAKICDQGRVGEIILPVAMKNAKNNAHHWYVGLLTIHNTTCQLSIVESTQMARQFLLPDLQAKFADHHLPIVNRLLARHDIAPIEPDTIHYMQSLQYSLRGCGIAAVMNMQKLIFNHHKPSAFSIDDIIEKSSHVIFVNEQPEMMPVTEAQLVQILYDGHDLNHVLGTQHLTLAFKKTHARNDQNTIVIHDRSLRFSMLEDALNRVVLALFLDQHERHLHNIEARAASLLHAHNPHFFKDHTITTKAFSRHASVIHEAVANYGEISRLEEIPMALQLKLYDVIRLIIEQPLDYSDCLVLLATVRFVFEENMHRFWADQNLCIEDSTILFHDFCSLAFHAEQNIEKRTFFLQLIQDSFVSTRKKFSM